MDRKDGPTVFDINKPNTYGATPSARPVITGHQPTMPDPMVTDNDTPSEGSKIKVKVKKDNLNRDELASSLFPQVKETDEPSVMAGGPLQSPAFRSGGGRKSGAATSPYMP